MKFFFDARYIRTDFHDGVSRYSTELGRAVAAQAPVTFLISDPGQRDLLPAGVETIMLHGPTSALEPVTALRLNRHRPDVVFTPLQTMGALGRRFKLILTLQDIIYYRDPTPPTNLPPHIRLGWWLFHQAYWPQRLVLDRADAVATVSETSRSYIERYRLTRRPITVVSNAPSPLINIPEAGESGRELVYVGSFMPYKNTGTLIKAMAHLSPDYTLHLVSPISAGREAELSALIPAERTVIFHRGVTEAGYLELLTRAHALLTASKVEGFGLPIVEAQRAGVPVICSETDIFTEVAGPGALFFPPEDAEALAGQVRTLEDETVRQRIVETGRANAARFSWDRSAAVLLDLAQRLADSR
ncbi:glycosyltransferase family 4 protein [Microlunatus speluncae]|uniref:glycosyltransferase family 4 protein n=1 Tax=Microlunatus speluncae TaxID=2594267 RepID=UPI0012664CA7|nr:glycosyltransferase family 1 protein [Microlunatus speluncae]